MNLLTVGGDPHVTPDSLEKINLLFDIIEDLGNPTILLGDLFDTKEIIRGKCQNLVLKRLKESKLHFYILVGNHDWFNLDCLDHSLQFLKELKNVTVVDKPTHINIDSWPVLLLPYYNDIAALKAVLDEAKKGGTDYVFMHQGITGFDYGNGHIADGNGSGETSLEMMSGFKRVISGHFHKYAEEGNFTFLGTPFSHSFGESDQVKYIGVFNPDENDLQLLETPFPRHRTISFQIDKYKNPMESLKKKLTGSKDIFRVYLFGTEMEIKAIDQSQFPGVKFLEEPTDAEQVEDATLAQTDSNEQKFLQWAKEIKCLDDETVSLGLSLLEEAG